MGGQIGPPIGLSDEGAGFLDHFPLGTLQLYPPPEPKPCNSNPPEAN